MTLEQIKAYAEKVAGNWNGEDAGMAEDRAMIANDILDAVKSIEELLAQL
jgi:hypothetical protein